MAHAVPLFNLWPQWTQVFWLSYVAWFLMEMWILRRDRRAVAGETKDQGSRATIMLGLWVGLILAFASAYRVSATRIALDAEPLFWSAIALIWVGMAFRLWAVLTLGRFFRTSVVVQDDHRLITHGPYRFLRNPSYTGGLVTLIGIGLAMGNWLSVLFAAGGFLAGFGWRIRVEEQALAARFGEAWSQYRRRTWAIIPLLW